jgi:pimeloyl-ACP methyl ester carboxylesterase
MTNHEYFTVASARSTLLLSHAGSKAQIPMRISSRWIRPALGGLAATLLFVRLAVSANPAEAALSAPPGKLVDIGGRKLHLHCTGNGSPTIVLEAGAGAFAIDWALVQPEIARSNRVCSYDRAGQGWSDQSTAVETPARVVQDLHAALQVAGEKPPYVMVGASMGGIFVREYEIKYPEEVVGMALVDPTHEDRLFTMLRGEGVAISSLTAEQFQSTIPPGPAQIPEQSPETGSPFDKLPSDLFKLRVALETHLIASLPKSVPHDVVVESAEGGRAAFVELHQFSAAKKYPLGDRPLVVLTRGLDSSQDLKDAHASLSRLSSNSRHSIVADSGHEIHLYKPGAVIQAVEDVLKALRNKEQLPPN